MEIVLGFPEELSAPLTGSDRVKIRAQVSLTLDTQAGLALGPLCFSRRVGGSGLAVCLRRATR